MIHLKKYESYSRENIQERLYGKWKEFIDSLIEIFEEFEDSGWYWSTGKKAHYDGRGKSISLDWWPEFNCIMLNSDDDNDVYIPANQRNVEVDVTGYFLDGDIKFDTNIVKWGKYDDKVKKVKEEKQDFIVAVKRLYDATGVDFSFSYNNKGGEFKIVIRGIVKIEI